MPVLFAACAWEIDDTHEGSDALCASYSFELTDFDVGAVLGGVSDTEARLTNEYNSQ